MLKATVKFLVVVHAFADYTSRCSSAIWMRCEPWRRASALGSARRAFASITGRQVIQLQPPVERIRTTLASMEGGCEHLGYQLGPGAVVEMASGGKRMVGPGCLAQRNFPHQ